MKRCGLAVGCDKDKFNDAQRECLKYNVFIRLTSDIPEALVELYKEHNYLLAANRFGATISFQWKTVYGI